MVSDWHQSEIFDEADEISTLSRSKMSSKAGLDEKFKALQQAEEAYYQNKVKKKSSGLPDKKIVSEELREGSKKRLLNALNQAQERLGEQLPAIEASVTLLEMECFKKYEKVGKTFYNSQVAATIRWISSSSFEQICDRLNTSHSRSSAKSNDDYHSNATPSPQSHLANSDGADYSETSKEITHEIVQLSMEIPREKMELPPILSLSEFAEKNAKGDGSARSSSISGVQKRPDNLGRSNPEKKMRQG